MIDISYRGHRFPPIVIQRAVWLYLRFTLSYRDVEELLAERGLDVSYETVRSWVLKFGPIIARRLRRRAAGCARGPCPSDPILLLMDESFSALDVLTAETLRADFLDLWVEHQLPTKAVLIVTHNIEEAVLMCDRILVLGSNPGHIAAEIPVALDRRRACREGRK